MSLLVIACLLLATHVGRGEPSSIPEAEIAALRQELTQGGGGSTPAEVRRAYKHVIRQAQALLDAAPAAPNRFAVLGVIFDGQMRVLAIANDQPSREAVYATARQLQQAPDEFADLRLGADLVLMEKSMAEQRASVAERSRALVELLAAYRGTPAEWKSLLIGTRIATKLDEVEVVNAIENQMFERFAGDHQAIQYQRTERKVGRLDVVFRGTYRTADGTSLSLPLDRWGHQTIAYFWSVKTPHIDDYLLEMKEMREAQAGRFEVISFNVDELPDAGQEKLRSLGLDWTAVHLPGGRENSTYIAYARTDPYAVFINAQGHVLLDSRPKTLGLTAVEGVREGAPGMPLARFGWNRLDDERYLAQLRSLFIGDYLVAALPESASIPAAILQPIQACFTPPPLRYRLTRGESLENYRQAVALCTSALGNLADSADAWMIRNRKIIALLGLWNLEADPRRLDEAVAEATIVLGMNLPPGADVVARVCLAKNALRQGAVDPEKMVAGLIESTGGDKAPASAFAAATLLALEANAWTAYGEYRKQLLDFEGDEHPALWPVCTFVRDPYHGFRNFSASSPSRKFPYRLMVSALADPLPRDTRVRIELQTLDGERLPIPPATPDRMLAVIFAEPSENADAPGGAFERAKTFAGVCREYGVDPVVALLRDDRQTARALAHDATDFQVALVPDGLKNPLVGKLGILSADRVPNVFLFRADGTLAWMTSGLHYEYSSGEGAEKPITLAIANNIEKVRNDACFEFLERGDYETALKQFEAYAPPDGKPDWWANARKQGRALAYMGLKNWTAALEVIDEVLKDALRGPSVWRCKCHGVVELYLTKATILEQLDRKPEADAARKLAAEETLPHYMRKRGGGEYRAGVPVGLYYDRLKQIRLGLDSIQKDPS